MIHPDIVLIDKPKGITSFDCIRILRKKLGVRKMGHAGTLDPLATGLMIIAFGDGTKKLHEFLKLSKRYVAEILLGVKTDTGDVTGKVIEESPVKEITEAILKKVLESMQGDIILRVPLYSAIKKDGKPLYAYAREHKEVIVPEKTMHIIASKILEITGDIAIIEFNVKSGTYIRSLAEELGARLGTVATLKNLRRTSIGDFSIEQAEKI